MFVGKVKDNGWKRRDNGCRGRGDYGCRERRDYGCRGRGKAVGVGGREETMVVEEGKGNGCRWKRREMVVGEEERRYLRLLFQLKASEVVR